MQFTITPLEVRILGCLIEKEATTPDVYPLTLNSLLTACNQKSSREPIMDVNTIDVTAALDSLIGKTLVSTWNADRKRMPKYRHMLHNRVSEQFDFSRPELAVLGVLFLRGPQTPGEIRSRCSRIHEFDGLNAVQAVLSALAENPDGPYTTMLPRQEGRKESRYAHLFCGEPEQAAVPDIQHPGVTASGGGASRLDTVELELGELRAQVQELQQRFERFTKQFE